MRNGSNSKRSRMGRPGGGRSRPAGTNRSRNIESNGPAGKVRGNIAQIIDKYQLAARDALSAGDRVVSESCLQYAEHYHRLMTGNTDADPEERRDGGGQAVGSESAKASPEQGDAGRGEAAQAEGRRRGPRRGPRQVRDAQPEPQPDAVAERGEADVEAPEAPAPAVAEDAAPAPKRTRVRKTPTRSRRPAAADEVGDVDANAAPKAAEAGEGEAAEDDGIRRTAQRGRTRTTRGQRAASTRGTTRTTRTRRRVAKEAAEGEAAGAADGGDQDTDSGDSGEGGSKAAKAAVA